MNPFKLDEKLINLFDNTEVIIVGLDETHELAVIQTKDNKVSRVSFAALFQTYERQHSYKDELELYESPYGLHGDDGDIGE